MRRTGIWMSVVVAVVVLAGAARGQWSPSSGQWGKTETRDLRVMTWNVQDALCTTQPKVEGFNSWCALARIVAVLKPDVLVLQECGDNSGNGTGSGVDSVANLTTVMNLFVNGGTDPFLGGAVTSYVRLYAPTVSLPYVYVADQTDGFNRNVVLSRYPFTDLNGDTRTSVSTFFVSADLYVPSGGNAGIRGFVFSEIDLPDGQYAGDVVVGTCHLKSGGASGDLAERLIASQRTAYYIDYLFNGGGGSTPDPRARIADAPAATRVLTAETPVIWGGDFNEDENTNGRNGPAWWMTKAATDGGTDGTDRDRSDSRFDDSRDPLNANNTTNRYTQGSSKLDYLCWQDSVAALRRSFVFVASTAAAAAVPAELATFSSPSGAGILASDHRPVVADFVLPVPATPPGAFSLISPADGAVGVSLDPVLSWSASSGATSYTAVVSLSPTLSPAVWTASGLGSTSVQVPGGVLSTCGTYYWGVVASGPGGNRASSPASRVFQTPIPADFNGDGFLDFFDFDEFVDCFEGVVCPPGGTADFDGDGFVDFFDFDAFVIAFDQGC